MKSQPYYVRLSFLAFMLLIASRYFPAEPLHVLVQCTGCALLIWALVLMVLRKTGKSQWDGPNWATKLRSSARFRRVLAVVPALCAACIPILFLLNRRWGLSNGQLGFACGVLLGIAFVALIAMKSKNKSCCGPTEILQTQQDGTK